MSWFRRSAKPQSEPQTESQSEPQSAPAPAHSALQPVVAPPVTFTPAAASAFAATMMDYPLTLQHIYNRGRRLFPNREIVTSLGDSYERSTYGEVFARVERLAAALEGLGVRRGDRVATLAWNSTRHYELYFAVPCMGAVLHTLNLRLPPHQAAFIIKAAADKVIYVDADLGPLLMGE
jgi:acyl-CoA synthetase (AMP-forming)/AMP-acid ligase II